MIKVWDLSVRVFHWGLVTIVLANRFYNEGGGSWHEWLGYLACGLIAGRIAWGFYGSRYARFSEMKASWPRRGEFLAHLKRYLRGKEPRSMGHPPLALIGMASLLICILLLGLTGYLQSFDRFFGEEWLQNLHEWLANILLGLALIHVVGVLRESYLHRENLIGAMIHGKKRSGE